VPGGHQLAGGSRAAAGRRFVEPEFWLTSISVCSERSWIVIGLRLRTSAAVVEACGGLELALGVDDLSRGARARLSAWRAIACCMRSGISTVLDLDRRDLHAPGLGLVVDDLLEVLVEALALGPAARRARPCPSTERSVVWAICDVAARTFSISMTERVGSITR